MAFRPSRALLAAAVLWPLGLAALAVALERPAPLFVNLGPGDEPFARGFRGGWERDGVTRSGLTAFRWTEDGARLEFPVVVLGGALEARLRMARFAEREVEMALLLGGRVVQRWTQPPRGFGERRFALGELRGPLMLRFRSEGEDALGVALDWAEVHGARGLRPRQSLLPGLLAALLGAPLLLAAFAGAHAGLFLAVFAAWAGAAAIWTDRLGGLVALASSGLPALLALASLGLLKAVLRRAWPEHLDSRAALVGPAAAVFVACLGLFQPFFHYPDVDTHARFLAAIRADPWVALDPREFQARTGAWTRTIGGERVAFPYAPFFHLAAWPLAPALGEAGAVKGAAALSLGLTLVLAYAVARALAAPPAWAMLAQLLLALLPVTVSRLSLALFPALFGQALEALLAVHLLRRFGHLDGARDAAAAASFLLLAQAAYTGSIINVCALVLAFAALQALLGEHRRALRLLGAYAAAAAAVALLLYARFLPVLLAQVLPNALRAPAGDAGVEPSLGGFLRLGAFYDTLPPLLAGLGLAGATGAAPHARRCVLAWLLAGSALLFLRGALPTLLRDAKDVELLAVPVAACAALGLRRLWRSGEAGRVAAAGALAVLLAWSLPRCAASYAARFVAVGR